ncbi:MAG: VWA domain-containing protein [Planctomycetota bacterium]|jgi:hypothetical protein|nr:VWA domain-containing protein [Planctomycetota bacterium]
MPAPRSDAAVAFGAALAAMTVLLLLAGYWVMWDVDNFRVQVERLFAVDLTPLPPPPASPAPALTAPALPENFYQGNYRAAENLPSLPAAHLPELPPVAMPAALAVPPLPALNLPPAAAGKNWLPAPVVASPELRRPATDSYLAPVEKQLVLSGRNDNPPPPLHWSAPVFALPPPSPPSPENFQFDVQPDFQPAAPMPVLPPPVSERRSLENDLTAQLFYAPPTAADPSPYFQLSLTVRADSALPALAKDVLFLLDVSQSISSDAIRAMREAIGDYLQTLPAGDRWNVVKFSERVHRFSPDFLPAGEIPASLSRFFSRPSGEYMTDLFRVTQMILARQSDDGRPCNIFLITDGFANYGVKEVRQLVKDFSRAQRDHFSIFTFMVGDKGRADLLELLAYRSRGFFRRQTSTATAAAEMRDFFRAYEAPVLFACAANCTGTDAVFPRVLPNLYRGQPLILRGRGALSERAVIRVAGLNAAPREFYFRPAASAVNPAANDLRAAWAYGYALEILQTVIDAPDKNARAAALTRLSEVARAYGLTALTTMARLIGD